MGGAPIAPLNVFWVIILSFVLGRLVQSRDLEVLSGCEQLGDLREVVEMLHEEHGRATLTSTVRHKYRSPQLGAVANILGRDPDKIAW